MNKDPLEVNSVPAYVAFLGPHRVAGGDMADVTRHLRQVVQADELQNVLIFDAQSRRVELDLRSAPAKAPATPPSQNDNSITNDPAPSLPLSDASQGPGRPRLGVVAREVTLLPRHWEWLGKQNGGASVALRKLVDEARRANAESDFRREARDAAYRFMSAMAGDLPGFEEASRALFADDRGRFDTETGSWPPDICNHLRVLAAAAMV